MTLQATQPKELEVGWSENVPEEDYHAWSAVGSTTLRRIVLESPAHAKEGQDNPKDATPALILGSFVHTIVLEPQLVNRKYVVANRCDARKKNGEQCSNPGKMIVGGAWLCGVHADDDRHQSAYRAIDGKLLDEGFEHRFSSEAGSVYYTHPDGRQVRVSDHAPNMRTRAWMFRESVQDIRVDLPPYGSDDPRTIVTPDQYEAAQAMAESVRAHPKAREILSVMTEHELSGVWQDAQTGVLCKMRADIISRKARILGDLKTARTAHPQVYPIKAHALGYHIQMGHYRNGATALEVPVDTFCQIVVENVPPYTTTVFEPDEAWMTDGVNLARLGLIEYAKCVETNEWPGYSRDIVKLSLPKFRLHQMALDAESEL